MLAGAARGQETSPGSRLGERSGAQQMALEGPAVPGQLFGEARGEERRGGEVLSEQKAPAVPLGGIQDRILPGFIAGRGEHPWLKLLLARGVAPSIPSSLSVQAGGANPNFSP